MLEVFSAAARAEAGSSRRLAHPQKPSVVMVAMVPWV